MGELLGRKEVRGIRDVLMHAVTAPRLEAAKVAQARRSFLDAIPILWPGFAFNWHHIATAEHLQRVADGQLLNLMLCMPPQHGKTLTASELFAAWVLGRQDENFFAATYSAQRAQSNCRAVQRIMHSPGYRQVFPDAAIPERSSARHGWEVSSQGFNLVGHETTRVYRGFGAGGGGTGFPRSIGLLDDLLKNHQDAKSPTIRNRLWEWYAAVYSARENKLKSGAGGAIRTVMINTRWDEDDPSGRLLDSEGRDTEGGKWTVLSFPAILDEEAAANRHPLDHRQIGEALWPDMMDVDRLMERKNLLPTVFEALYQQRPRSVGDTLFRAEWFKRYDGPPPPGKWVVSCDMNFGDTDAQKKKELKSFAAIQVWVLGYDKTAHFVDHVHEQLDFPRALAAMKALLLKYPQISEFIVEAKANGAAVIQTLRANGIKVTAYEPNGSKIARAGAVAPWVEAGQVHIANNAAGNLVIANCKNFPAKGTDDTVDAMSQLLTELGPSPLDALNFFNMYTGRRR